MGKTKSNEMKYTVIGALDRGCLNVVDIFCKENIIKAA